MAPPPDRQSWSSPAALACIGLLGAALLVVGILALVDDAVVVTVNGPGPIARPGPGATDGPRLWLFSLDDHGRLTITIQTRQPYFGSRDYLSDVLPWFR